MTEFDKKVAQAIHLLQSIPQDSGPVEISYSGGKRNYSKEDVADFVMRMNNIIPEHHATVYWKESVRKFAGNK